MSDNGTEFTTPVGRIVWGHPGKPRNKTDQQNNPVLDQNGQPVKQWSFGLAIPKAEFQQFVWPMLYAEASKGYPQGQPPSFSWKYNDGDGIDKDGKPFAAREGYAGCYVLAISTELQAPGIFKADGSGGFRQMAPEEIKCGDYVQCGINLKVNIPTNRQHTPGIYVNPLAVNHVGYGTEIQSGFQADPNALFGAAPVALPPGASATPIATAPAGVQMPGMGVPPQQPMQPPVQQPMQPPVQQPMQPPVQQPMQPPVQQPMQPGYMPPPATDFIPQQPGQPIQQPAMPGMPPPR